MTSQFTKYQIAMQKPEIETWDLIEFDDNDTVDERAKKLGLSQYDTALPQQWCDDVFAKTTVWPYGKFVWSYFPDSLFGWPAPLTREALNLLHRYNDICAMHRAAYGR